MAVIGVVAMSVVTVPVVVAAAVVGRVAAGAVVGVLLSAVVFMMFRATVRTGGRGGYGRGVPADGCAGR
jgi:hypothetical protein